MPDSVIRKETTHIDEVARTATASTQWLLENRNIKGAATHPITHNNQLQFFICGESGFADIAQTIAKAQQSIDLVCWGFDPGMELVRSQSIAWPRGTTYGELLLAAARRGVKVRLLVWYDAIGSIATSNVPGMSFGPLSRAAGAHSSPKDISPQRSVAIAVENWCASEPGLHDSVTRMVKAGQLPVVNKTARDEYCHSWFQAAFGGTEDGWANIEVRTRGGKSSAIKRSLQAEEQRPASLSALELESVGMKFLGTHHQKPILIDYAVENGAKAVGYVMGLNSVTDYWDTEKHTLNDPLREEGLKLSAQESLQRPRCANLASCDQPNKCRTVGDCINVSDPTGAELAAARKVTFHAGFRSMKPYRDYACRITAGQSLVCLYNNFINAWDRAGKQNEQSAAHATSKKETAHCAIPSALQRKATAGDSSVQIVRTQPEEDDKTIKEIYTLAAAKAALACGYLYIENQYFQYEDWTRRLVSMRKQVIAGWKAGSVKAGKSVRDMPMLHVFIVIPVPEKEGMVPRTYDALAVLGQQGTMTGQNALIDKMNTDPAPVVCDAMGNPTGASVALPAVVEHANTISKPDLATLENTFGMKVSVAMLQTCGVDQDRWRYREIYIHSKLLLVDDSFLTLGSANLNQRSMAVDSEINIATDDPRHARDLRKRVWGQLSGGNTNGKTGTRAEIADTFTDWTTLMKDNRARKYGASQKRDKRQLVGFLLPLDDNRSSTTRLG